MDPLLGPPSTSFESTINQNTNQWSHHHGSLQQQQQHHHHLSSQMPNTNLTQQLQSGNLTLIYKKSSLESYLFLSKGIPQPTPPPPPPNPPQQHQLRMQQQQQQHPQLL